MENKRKYTDMNQQERYERLEQARNNSVKSRNSNIINIDYQGKKYKVNAKRLKVAVVTAFLATAIASTALGIGLTKGVEKLQDDNEVYQEVSNYAHIVYDNTYRTSENDGYWYNTINMADDILKEEDKPLAVYAAYKKMKCGTYENKVKHMDTIMRCMSDTINYEQDKYSGIRAYGTFDDYLIQNECVDKEGKPSLDVYESKMNDYILKGDKNNIFGQAFVNSETVVNDNKKK